jgi:hypothetical protein
MAIRLLCVALCLAQGLRAQVWDHVVVTATPAPHASTVLLVDSSNGSWTALAPFLSDHLTPRAVACDPLTGGIVLGLDEGGATRVVALPTSGTAGERRLGQLPGPCGDLQVMRDGEIIATIGGAAGGLWIVPRDGSMPALLLSVPYASRLARVTPGTSPFEELAMIGSSSSQGTSTTPARVNFVDFLTSALQPRDLPPGFSSELVGITWVFSTYFRSRLLFVFADGTFVDYSEPYSGPPLITPLQVGMPPGGVVALEHYEVYVATLLGGAVFPYLYTFNPYVAGYQPIPFAGPFPGAPVDFSRRVVGPALYSLGRTCTGHANGVNGQPLLGTANFGIGCFSCIPNTATLLVGGTTFFTAQSVPFVVPASLLPCGYFVQPDSVSLDATNAQGIAVQARPIPNLPELSGLMFYWQWLQVTPSGLLSSRLIVTHLGG